ncbi:hypothetical protein BESB_083310 [Besnoitia besnoiti]|uniref:AP2 domain transcription factor AP2VIII-1 n=1 Tax=Besnoitia besnoiti TaxID=94643 RepID=A0A2A9MCM4_BESBE|nr:hypothetical protein BESB_083310 [Besnoitia besnoiti]PFH33132.1 hypothetical protein BESB_083310 [Besnoitia besnoiti]
MAAAESTQWRQAAAADQASATSPSFLRAVSAAPPPPLPEGGSHVLPDQDHGQTPSFPVNLGSPTQSLPGYPASTPSSPLCVPRRPIGASCEASPVFGAPAAGLLPRSPAAPVGLSLHVGYKPVAASHINTPCSSSPPLRVPASSLPSFSPLPSASLSVRSLAPPDSLRACAPPPYAAVHRAATPVAASLALPAGAPPLVQPRTAPALPFLLPGDEAKAAPPAAAWGLEKSPSATQALGGLRAIFAHLARTVFTVLATAGSPHAANAVGREETPRSALFRAHDNAAARLPDSELCKVHQGAAVDCGEKERRARATEGDGDAATPPTGRAVMELWRDLCSGNAKGARELASPAALHAKVLREGLPASALPRSRPGAGGLLQAGEAETGGLGGPGGQKRDGQGDAVERLQHAEDEDMAASEEAVSKRGDDASPQTSVASPSTCVSSSACPPSLRLDPRLSEEEEMAFHVETLLHTCSRQDLADYATVFLPFFGVQPLDLASHCDISLLRSVALQLQAMRRLKDAQGPQAEPPAGAVARLQRGDAVSPTPRVARVFSLQHISPEGTPATSRTSSPRTSVRAYSLSFLPKCGGESARGGRPPTDPSAAQTAETAAADAGAAGGATTAGRRVSAEEDAIRAKAKQPDGEQKFVVTDLDMPARVPLRDAGSFDDSGEGEQGRFFLCPSPRLSLSSLFLGEGGDLQRSGASSPFRGGPLSAAPFALREQVFPAASSASVSALDSQFAVCLDPVDKPAPATTSSGGERAFSDSVFPPACGEPRWGEGDRRRRSSRSEESAGGDELGVSGEGALAQSQSFTYLPRPFSEPPPGLASSASSPCLLQPKSPTDASAEGGAGVSPACESRGGPQREPAVGCLLGCESGPAPEHVPATFGTSACGAPEMLLKPFLRRRSSGTASADAEGERGSGAAVYTLSGASSLLLSRATPPPASAFGPVSAPGVHAEVGVTAAQPQDGTKRGCEEIEARVPGVAGGSEETRRRDLETEDARGEGASPLAAPGDAETDPMAKPVLESPDCVPSFAPAAFVSEAAGVSCGQENVKKEVEHAAFCGAADQGADSFPAQLERVNGNPAFGKADDGCRGRFAGDAACATSSGARVRTIFSVETMGSDDAEKEARLFAANCRRFVDSLTEGGVRRGATYSTQATGAAVATSSENVAPPASACAMFAYSPDCRVSQQEVVCPDKETQALMRTKTDDTVGALSHCSNAPSSTLDADSSAAASQGYAASAPMRTPVPATEPAEGEAAAAWVKPAAFAGVTTPEPDVGPSGVRTPSTAETMGEERRDDGKGVKKPKKRRRNDDASARADSPQPDDGEGKADGKGSKNSASKPPPAVTIGLVGRPGGAYNLVTRVVGRWEGAKNDFSVSRVVRLSNKAMELPYVHGVRFEAETFAWTARIGVQSRRFLVKKHGFQKSRLYAIEKIELWRRKLPPDALARELQAEQEILATLPAVEGPDAAPDESASVLGLTAPGDAAGEGCEAGQTASGRSGASCEDWEKKASSCKKKRAGEQGAVHGGGGDMGAASPPPCSSSLVYGATSGNPLFSPSFTYAATAPAHSGSVPGRAYGQPVAFASPTSSASPAPSAELQGVYYPTNSGARAEAGPADGGPMQPVVVVHTSNTLPTSFFREPSACPPALAACASTPLASSPAPPPSLPPSAAHMSPSLSYASGAPAATATHASGAGFAAPFGSPGGAPVPRPSPLAAPGAYSPSPAFSATMQSVPRQMSTEEAFVLPSSAFAAPPTAQSVGDDGSEHESPTAALARANGAAGVPCCFPPCAPSPTLTAQAYPHAQPQVVFAAEARDGQTVAGSGSPFPFTSEGAFAPAQAPVGPYPSPAAGPAPAAVVPGSPQLFFASPGGAGASAPAAAQARERCVSIEYQAPSPALEPVVTPAPYRTVSPPPGSFVPAPYASPALGSASSYAAPANAFPAVLSPQLVRLPAPYVPYSSPLGAAMPAAAAAPCYHAGSVALSERPGNAEERRWSYVQPSEPQGGGM